MGVAPHVTTITLGCGSPQQLDATYPHTPGAPVMTLRRTASFCVCLLGIAARRDCPFHPMQAEPSRGTYTDSSLLL